MPESGRKVGIPYRSVLLRDVPVGSLYQEVLLRVSAAVKTAAIEQDLIRPLQLEATFGLCAPEGPAKMATLSEEVVEQASWYFKTGLGGRGGGGGGRWE